MAWSEKKLKSGYLELRFSVHLHIIATHLVAYIYKLSQLIMQHTFTNYHNSSCNIHLQIIATHLATYIYILSQLIMQHAFTNYRNSSCSISQLILQHTMTFAYYRNSSCSIYLQIITNHLAASYLNIIATHHATSYLHVITTNHAAYIYMLFECLQDPLRLMCFLLVYLLFSELLQVPHQDLGNCVTFQPSGILQPGNTRVI